MTSLDPIRSRLAAATPGPWSVDELGDVETVPTFDLHRFDIMPETIARTELRKEDGVFIANAPTDMARLLAAIDAATEALGKHGNPPPISDGTFEAGYRAGRRALRAIVEQYITQALEGK